MIEAYSVKLCEVQRKEAPSCEAESQVKKLKRKFSKLRDVKRKRTFNESSLKGTMIKKKVYLISNVWRQSRRSQSIADGNSNIVDLDTNQELHLFIGCDRARGNVVYK